MRLTIIRNMGLVSVDGLGYDNLDVSSVPENVNAVQWYETFGDIEYIDSTPNLNITELPLWVQTCLDYYAVAFEQQKKAEAEYQALINSPEYKKTINKNKASELLYKTDWTTIPDVSDPTKSSPYLSNVQDFVIYRNAVRQYAINPIPETIEWPVVPTAVWS